MKMLKELKDKMLYSKPKFLFENTFILPKEKIKKLPKEVIEENLKCWL